MSCSRWREVRLGDVIEFNPRESISKKQKAKKIAMEKLKPFTKFIDEYEFLIRVIIYKYYINF